MFDEMVRTLDRLGEKRVATSLLDVFRRHSTQFVEFDKVAQVAFETKRFMLAMTAATSALELAPDFAKYDASYNLANAAAHANLPEASLLMIEQMEEVRKDDTDREMLKAFALFMNNQKKEAEEVLRSLIDKVDPASEAGTKLRFNLGTYHLLRDEFRTGMRLFLENGRSMKFWAQNEVAGLKEWSGVTLPDRTIVISSEGGIGDEVINFRFVKTIRDRGMRPVWLTSRHDLVSVFERSGAQVVTDLTSLPDDSLWCRSMDLPILLDLDASDLWHRPYIEPPHDLTVLPPREKNMRVGIRWQGNPAYEQDLNRTVPVDELVSTLLSLEEEIDIFSLQRDHGANDVPFHLQPRVVDLQARMQTIDDTLAIIRDLDLVITSCTSIAHLSAAMGKETIVLVPIAAYYPWCHSTEKSPWYGDNVTIIRQSAPRTWSSELETLKKIMNERMKQ